MARFYLGGPINGCSDEEASGWREAVKKVLQESGDTWCDPMDRDYRGRELEPGIDVEIVERDKEDILSCDIVIANSPKPSYGTAMEILFAYEANKIVAVVLPKYTTPSPWITYHADQIHYESAVDAVQFWMRFFALRRYTDGGTVIV